MPTIDDLRAVLRGRESSAGDVESVRATLSERRPRRVAPLVAAAAVLALAGGAAVLAGNEHGTDAGNQAGASADPSAWISADAPPPPTTTPPATTAPPHQNTALTWGFSVGHVPGYTVRRSYYDPYGQSALIEGPGDLSGTIMVHPRGAFDASGLQGDEVTANGKRIFSADTSHARLVWQYTDDSWAELSMWNLPTSDDRAAARTLIDRLAAAVRFGASGDVTEPFALRNLPSAFTVEAAMQPAGSRACIGYGTGDGYPNRDAQPVPDLGTVLTVCRVTPGETTNGLQNADDRFLIQDLGDGTVLRFAVNANHLDEVSQADLVQFAKHADTSPKLDDQSTWLPVGG